MRRLAPVTACALALAACGSDHEPESAAPARAVDAEAALAGAPRPLAALHAQASELLDGGAPEFERRLRELRGYPVVVNKWASWCPPCRAEFPFFQKQSLARGRKLAFLGVDSDDAEADARRFLRQYPVSFPSYRDPKLEVASVFDGVQAFPSTAFYDRRGRLAYLHQGGYASEAKLAADIERYAR